VGHGSSAALFHRQAGLVRSSAWIWLTWGFVGQDIQIGLHVKFPFVDRYPRSEPVCMTRPVSDAASNSHPVAALNGRTNIPLASGEGSGGRDHSLLRLFEPSQISVRSP
jgi:hypothetical protein